MFAQGEEHIRKQHRIIAELEDHGHDARTARDLLKSLEDVQTMHVADKERLEEEMKRYRDATSA